MFTVTAERLEETGKKKSALTENDEKLNPQHRSYVKIGHGNYYWFTFKVKKGKEIVHVKSKDFAGSRLSLASNKQNKQNYLETWQHHC